MYNQSTTMTPAHKMWEIIDTARFQSGMNKQDLAKKIGVHPNTVTRDSGDPEHIPQGRLWLYCKALGLSTNDVLQTLASQLADRF